MRPDQMPRQPGSEDFPPLSETERLEARVAQLEAKLAKYDAVVLRIAQLAEIEI